VELVGMVALVRFLPGLVPAGASAR
jgi:hypothetical protein